MIKRQKREFKIAGLCVIFTLLFLCIFNVTYAYFTAVATVTGSQTFYNMNVKFGYTAGASYEISDTTFTVTPSESVISRGDEFGIKYNNTEITNLYFWVAPYSCDSYVRFMLDAYKVDSSGTQTSSVNYGQYFEIIHSSNSFTRKVVTNGDTTNAVYYMNDAVTTTVTSYFCEKIKLLDTAPVDVLDGRIKLTITFSAVQKSNKAYEAVFNDGWGYLNTWE